MTVVRYFFVGGAAAAVDFGLFGLLLLLGGEAHWFLAAAASFVIATAVNYFLSVRLVFASGVRFRKSHEVLLVFVVSLVGLALNQSFLWLFYKTAALHIWVAKCLATGVTFGWNYIARRSFIFRETK